MYYAHKLYLNGELVTELVIPDDVSEIKKCVFSGCDGLTSITIGNGVTSIGDYAFENCTNIVSITSLIPADKLFELGRSVFSGINKNSCTLYVPNEAIEAYLITKGWEDFINIIEVYNVNFIVENEIYTTYYIPEGNKILYPKVPEKEGYTFSGWSEAPKTMPAEDITITGSFTVNSYILTYIVDGEVYAIDSIAYGATIEPLEEPTKEGHTFSGWSEIPETMPAEDITITGSFTANSYIVTFIIDGEVYDTATVEYGTEIELPTPPEKEGYIFSGWVGVPETMPAEDIVIEGCYEVDTTGINAIELDLERNELYNLNGLQITETENLSRGFYIINGKKAYVK